LFTQRYFCTLPFSDVTNAASNKLARILRIDVTDKLYLTTLSRFSFERQVFVTTIASRLQLSKGSLAFVLILEQTNLPEFLAQEFIRRVTQKLHHKRIHVGDL